MTKNIYEQFDAATRELSAYAVFKGSDPVGRVVFKRTASGMRTTCFLQIWGSPMVKGVANGCGYDKDSASFTNAASQYGPNEPGRDVLGDEQSRRADFHAVKDNGYRWSDQLRELGYTVQHVID